MFHFGMWRERLRNDLTALAEDRTPQGPPQLDRIDEFNEAELANGIGTPLADAAARSDHLLAEIIGLYEKLGDRPLSWYRWTTTADAVLGNSFTHPRIHLYQYMRENGDVDRAVALLEDMASVIQEASSNPIVQGTARYNRACVRVHQGKLDEAIDNLQEAFRLRPEMKEAATTDSDLAPLREDGRFQELVRS